MFESFLSAGATIMKRDAQFLKSSLSFILVVAVVFFIIEITELLLTPMLEGVNELNNILIDAFIPAIIISPFVWWLVKYRDRFEEALKESEERFRTLFEGAPDAIFLADPDTGIIIEANSRASELIGRPREEIIGMHQAELHPPRMEEYSRVSFSEHARKIKKKEDIRPFENYVLRPDGTEVPVEVLAQMVTIKGRQVLQGVFRDITERKNAEKRVEASLKQVEEEKAKTESIIAAIGDAISIQDTDFKVLYQNKIHKDIVGDQKGMYCYRAYEHRDQICEGCPVNLSFKDGKIHTEERCLIRNEKKLYFEITASPLMDSTGNIIAGIEVGRNITERKRAEDVVRESETRLQSILDNSSTVIFLKDIQGRYITINRRYEELFHVKRNEVVNKTDYDIFPLEYADKFRKHDKQAVEKRSAIEMEEIVPHGDGLHTYISVKFPLLSPDGKLYAVCGIATDITERKRAEAAILEREERLHQAVRVSQIGIFDHDHRTDTIYWSPEQRHIYGWGPEEPVTLPAFLEHVYPEDRERIAGAVRRAHDPAGDGIFDVEHRIIDRNGSIHWLSTRSRTHFEGEGSSRHPVRTVGAVADITVLKSAEEVLKRYQLLSQNARDIILFIRANDGQILEANQAAVHAYGYERQVLVTKKILDLLAPGTRRPPTYQIEQANASGVIFETLHSRKDGSLFPVEVSSVGMPLEDSRVLLSIIRDITDRKEAEEQIMNSLREKEMLLREIHHRVKNNMQIISSLLWLQSGYIHDKKYLEMFRDSQNRITSMSLIHEKLYRSKDLEKIEFNGYIRDLLNHLFQSHGLKTGEIILNLNVDNVSLGIDQAIPCGLLINELITNSLKYAFPEDRKGEINVSLHLNDENMVELVVGDNGVGIPSNVDFRKTESLGLRLVTILAENQLQGKIDLDRTRGTEFKIEFKDGGIGKKTNIGIPRQD